MNMKQSFPLYDCIVIGKGLIGAAAGRYLKQSLEHVLVIGPDEPIDPDKAQVFASHYDQGRVQRIVGISDTWTKLNKESTDQYQFLQSESGINFHYPVGCLYVSPFKKDSYLNNAPRQAQQVGTSVSFFDSPEALHMVVPDFVFPPGSHAMLEHGPSGHINPLSLIQAQLKIFEKNIGVAVSDTVVKIEKRGATFFVYTLDGDNYLAHRVLITAGAFSNFNGLLPRPLDLELESETVLLAQVSETEAQRLAKLPSLLYELETQELNGIYLIRPVRYPDGNYYLKIGCNLATDIPFQNLDQIQQWFRQGDSDMNIPIVRKALHTIMPDLVTMGYKTKKCVISRTKHKHCYIGATDIKNLFVAAGGNGYSAMCSDALGRVAAHYALNDDVPSGFSKAIFEPIVI